MVRPAKRWIFQALACTTGSSESMPSMEMLMARARDGARSLGILFFTVMLGNLANTPAAKVSRKRSSGTPKPPPLGFHPLRYLGHC